MRSRYFCLMFSPCSKLDILKIDTTKVRLLKLDTVLYVK